MTKVLLHGETQSFPVEAGKIIWTQLRFFCIAVVVVGIVCWHDVVDILLRARRPQNPLAQLRTTGDMIMFQIDHFRSIARQVRSCCGVKKVVR